MFWYTWPSWVTELTAGAGLLLVLACPFGPVLALITAAALSVIYERYLDRNGWSWRDVGQRTAGILMAVALVFAKRALFG